MFAAIPFLVFGCCVAAELVLDEWAGGGGCAVWLKRSVQLRVDGFVQERSNVGSGRLQEAGASGEVPLAAGKRKDRSGKGKKKKTSPYIRLNVRATADIISLD